MTASRITFAASNHQPVVLVVKMGESPEPVPLLVVGWAWNEQRQEGEAVCVLGDGLCAAMSRLGEHGVTEVLGLGPINAGAPPAPRIAIPSVPL